jgi:alkanesulfonate monooxygenase SsuD/methylene tetrahydromethanopterin reductase-like flavin-dependent oxidoreductase (luciferase family)
VLAPTPHRPGGPPIWGGGSAPASLARAARNFDGWFPTGPEPSGWGDQWRNVQEMARAEGRDPAALTGAVYLTLSLDDDAERASDRIDAYLERYYGLPASRIRGNQACFAGPEAEAAAWLAGYADEGASHLVLRFVGDHERHLDAGARIRESLGW